MRLRHAAYNSLVRNMNSYLYLTGWMKSLEKSIPVDKDENPVPWMNYSIINFLRDRLTDDLDLFELGSGLSTRFFASKVRSVTSLEHNEIWYKFLKERLPENVELIYLEKDTDGLYCRFINTTGRKYDIVVIDGRDRVNCIKHSVESLSEKGVVLLDDSHRDRYFEGINFLKAQGFRSLDFEGLKPTGDGIDKTTLFYRSNNCMGI